MMWNMNNRFRSFDDVVCQEAARDGQLECLIYLQDNGCLWDVSTCVAAAVGGHIDLLRYAHDHHGCPWNVHTSSTAAANGHVNILRYLNEHGCPEDTFVDPGISWTMVSGCKMFSLAKLAYYACSDEEKSSYDDLGTLKIDLQRCCIDIMIYRENKSKLNIVDNDLHIKLIDDEDNPWTRTIRSMIAENEINYNHFSNSDVFVCMEAVFSGHLECLIYLHENGCLWDNSICLVAAEGGHIDILRYAHENGCPWNDDTYDMFVRYGFGSCLENGFEVSVEE